MYFQNSDVVEKLIFTAIFFNRRLRFRSIILSRRKNSKFYVLSKAFLRYKSSDYKSLIYKLYVKIFK